MNIVTSSRIHPWEPPSSCSAPGPGTSHSQQELKSTQGKIIGKQTEHLNAVNIAHKYVMYVMYVWLKHKTAFPAQHIRWIPFLKGRFKARLVHHKYSCRYLKQSAKSLIRLRWVCPNKTPLSALLACNHGFSPLLLLCKVRDVMSFIALSLQRDWRWETILCWQN